MKKELKELHEYNIKLALLLIKKGNKKIIKKKKCNREKQKEKGHDEIHSSSYQGAINVQVIRGDGRSY